MEFSWLKGHGTHNDFVLIDDPDGALTLEPEFIASLCDRRGGIGADGVLRVVRGSQMNSETNWFMDYYNADGSLSEMCGNGIRVFARFLVESGRETSPMVIGTRSGDKTVTVLGDIISVNMGVPVVGAETSLEVEGRTFPAQEIRTGNPHAVVFVDSLDQAGALTTAPKLDPKVFPEGANVEFVVREGDRHIAMRVFERGSGETQSCGTGACAAAIAAMGSVRDEYRVDLPGGTLGVTWNHDDSITLSGPAVLVAQGTMKWRG